MMMDSGGVGIKILQCKWGREENIFKGESLKMSTKCIYMYHVLLKLSNSG